MRKILAFLLTAAVLVVPALADGGSCEHHFEVTVLREATCVEEGLAAYRCDKCGYTYTAETPPNAAHTPEDAPATCVHSQVCVDCGKILVHATGHDYAYQYDAVRDENGNFTACGTWKCANCGKILPATEGNAAYYYSLPEAEQALAAPDADRASDTDAEPIEPATDTDLDEPEPAAEADGEDNDGLWIAISAAVVTAVVAEAVILVLSLRKKAHER